MDQLCGIHTMPGSKFAEVLKESPLLTVVVSLVCP